MLGGCVLWLSANHGVTLASGAVSQWSDLSGAGNHATQATVNDRPTVAASALNGQPAILFSGSATKALTHPLRLEPPCTVAFVAQTDATSDYHGIACFGLDLGGVCFFATTASNGNQWGLYANADAVSGASINTFKRGIAIVRAYNDVDFRTNGSSVTAATGVSGYVAASTIGNTWGGASLEGRVATILGFNRALTVAEALRLEAYWGAQYAL